MNNVKVYFKYENENDPEDLNLSMEYVIHEGMNISELHRMCTAFARALGYAEKSVLDYFGEDCFDD